TITVIDTNSFGCASVVGTLPVMVNPKPPLPVITGPNPVCQNSSTVYSVPNTSGYTYNWAVTGSTAWSSNGDTLTVTWGVPPSGPITVSQTNSATGCTSATATMNIVINPAPTPQTIVGNNLVCEYDSGVVYSITAIPGSSYVWTITGDTSYSTNGLDSATVNWGSAGGGTVTVVETNSFTCSTTNIISVTINAKPLASATVAPSDTTCANVQVQ